VNGAATAGTSPDDVLRDIRAAGRGPCALKFIGADGEARPRPSPYWSNTG
jgi:hypothetical protein